jgi:hypothetical protein
MMNDKAHLVVAHQVYLRVVTHLVHRYQVYEEIMRLAMNYPLPTYDESMLDRNVEAEVQHLRKLFDMDARDILFSWQRGDTSACAQRIERALAIILSMYARPNLDTLSKIIRLVEHAGNAVPKQVLVSDATLSWLKTPLFAQLWLYEAQPMGDPRAGQTLAMPDFDKIVANLANELGDAKQLFIDSIVPEKQQKEWAIRYLYLPRPNALAPKNLEDVLPNDEFELKRFVNKLTNWPAPLADVVPKSNDDELAQPRTSVTKILARVRTVAPHCDQPITSTTTTSTTTTISEQLTEDILQQVDYRSLVVIKSWLSGSVEAIKSTMLLFMEASPRQKFTMCIAWVSLVFTQMKAFASCRPVPKQEVSTEVAIAVAQEVSTVTSQMVQQIFANLNQTIPLGNYILPPIEGVVQKHVVPFASTVISKISPTEWIQMFQNLSIGTHIVTPLLNTFISCVGSPIAARVYDAVALIYLEFIFKFTALFGATDRFNYMLTYGWAIGVTTLLYVLLLRKVALICSKETKTTADYIVFMLSAGAHIWVAMSLMAYFTSNSTDPMDDPSKRMELFLETCKRNEANQGPLFKWTDYISNVFDTTKVDGNSTSETPTPTPVPAITVGDTLAESQSTVSTRVLSNATDVLKAAERQARNDAEKALRVAEAARLAAGATTAEVKDCFEPNWFSQMLVNQGFAANVCKPK